MAKDKYGFDIPEYGLGKVGAIRKINTGVPEFLTTDTVDVASDAIPEVSYDSTAFKTPETTSETGIWDSITGAFKPGEGGHSTAGNMLKGASDAVGAISGLGQLYFTKKNYDLQKEQADYLKNREKQQDARLGRFAANAGNGATY